MPTGSPPHREQPYAAPELRLAMVKAAVASQPAFVVDDRETVRIRRTGSVVREFLGTFCSYSHPDQKWHGQQELAAVARYSKPVIHVHGLPASCRLLR